MKANFINNFNHSYIATWCNVHVTEGHGNSIVGYLAKGDPTRSLYTVAIIDLVTRVRDEDGCFSR